jgi:AraC family transcriptional regulator of adaptative response/methylated-DNA-[protein]-cysteine methyltransferase
MARRKSTLPRDYQLATRAIAFIETHADEQPDLKRIADTLGLSPSAMNRLFSRWVGISPKRFLQSLTLDRSQRDLRAGLSNTSSALGSGLSGSSRLHDLFITFHGMSPGDFKREGKDLEIRYGQHTTPFGTCLIGLTDKGICWLSFHDGSFEEDLHSLGITWPGAALIPDQLATQDMVENIFPGNGQLPNQPLAVLVKGSAFQLQVWRALLGIPLGSTIAYGELAAQIDRPNAVRALGTAVGQNAISFLIPCHRVVRAGGHFGQYRWGAKRKKTILTWESLAIDRDSGF